ncbi:hypothetical protein ACVXG8_19270 [Escherichia coli]
MQVALIDYARHVANMENANSTEFVPDCKYPVVALITEWRDENGNVEVRSEKSDLGVPCVSAHSSASWLTIAWFASCTMRRQLLSVIVTVTKSTTCC